MDQAAALEGTKADERTGDEHTDVQGLLHSSIVQLRRNS
jgi:hypothetical protein